MLAGERPSSAEGGPSSGVAEHDDVGRTAPAPAPAIGLELVTDDVSPATSPDQPPGPQRTLRRSVSLLREFRLEQSDPDRFYGVLAADAVGLLQRRVPLQGRLVADVGCGAGYLSRALRQAGAIPLVVDRSMAELTWRGWRPESAALGDGYSLPLRSASVDVAVGCNMLEHVARPFDVIDELARVVRPGGHVWLSFTNWFGPWGGHETSPWHYLGADHAARRFERRHGGPPKNRAGETMFPVHVGPTLRYLRGHPRLEVVEALPRYHPAFARGIVHIPVVREVLTWNLEILARRTDSG